MPFPKCRKGAGVACSLLCVLKKSVVVMKVLKEYSVGTPLPGCPTALPSIADTSGEVSLQKYLSLIMVGLPVIIARPKAVAIRIPFHAKHGPFPKGTEKERIARR